jgi:hypothetical protein
MKSKSFSQLSFEEKREYLYKKGIFPKVHAFTNMQLRRKKSPESIDYTLCQCYLKHLKGGFEGRGPWGYCQSIVNKTSGNYYERDLRKEAQRQQRALRDLVDQGHFDDVLQGIG